MSENVEYKFRQVIPRWVDLSVATAFDNIAILGTNNFKFEPSLDYKLKLSHWNENKSLAFASDLVASALIFNDTDSDEVKSAAEFILKDRRASSLSSEAANSTLGRLARVEEPSFVRALDVGTLRELVASLKLKLQLYPRDPLIWLDLAYYYTVLGQDEQAVHAMSVAIGLSDNGYILRSASRLHFHLGDFARALHILRSSDQAKFNPLIISSEMAISDVAGLPSRLSKQGMRLLDSDKISPINKAELCSVVGSIEYKAGARKKCKRLIQRALDSPNENILAQVEFLSNLINLEIDPNSYTGVPATFEAEMRRASLEKNYDKAVSAAESWQLFQPYTAMPAISGSYFASVALNDFERAVKICRQGLISSPDEVMLLNNYAFALVGLDDLENAEKVINGIDLSSAVDQEKYTVIATKGLVAFRNGNVEEGRKFYSESIKGFEEENNNRSKSIALCLWGVEEAKLDDGKPEPIFNQSKELAKKLKIDEITQLIEFSENQIKSDGK